MVTDVGPAERVITRTRDAESSGGVFTDIGLVTWRSLVKLTRTPVLLFFSLFMPLIWLVMFSQTFGTVFSAAATQLPYDYVAVLLPGITVMTAIQSASQSGFGMVADLESGFMDKFFVAPIRRSSVLAGKLLADGLRMAAQTGIILGIAAILTLFASPIPVATGVPGAAQVSAQRAPGALCRALAIRRGCPAPRRGSRSPAPCDRRTAARHAGVELGREAIGRPAATSVDPEPQSPFDVDETDSFLSWVGACHLVLGEHFTPPRQSNVIRLNQAAARSGDNASVASPAKRHASCHVPSRPSLRPSTARLN